MNTIGHVKSQMSKIGDMACKALKIRIDVRARDAAFDYQHSWSGSGTCKWGHWKTSQWFLVQAKSMIFYSQFDLFTLDV